MSSGLNTRLKPIFRRSSSTSSARSSTSISSAGDPIPPFGSNLGKSSLRLGESRKLASVLPVHKEKEQIPQSPSTPTRQQQQTSKKSSQETPRPSPESFQATPSNLNTPTVVIERPTPERGRSCESSEIASPTQSSGRVGEADARANQASRPTIAVRRHSPIPSVHNRLFSAWNRIEQHLPHSSYAEYLSQSSTKASMLQRRIWVKRSGSSPTQIMISEDDLVDDVRDKIIKKYANSLGRSFDSPDVTIRLVQRKYSARQSNNERTLGPEEDIYKLVDLHYPGGQTVEEALIIDVPQRRTPKHSPRVGMPYYVSDNLRPGENQTDYFPPMAVPAPHSPQIPSNLSIASGPAAVHRPSTHAIAILETGQLPDLPSPGSRMTRHSHRPQFGRQHTSSPTVLPGNAITTDNLKGQIQQPVSTPPLGGGTSNDLPHRMATPPPRVFSPRPSKLAKHSRKATAENQSSGLSATSSLLDNAIPPINVLIVEDNIINLKLLEAFLKRLKVRWSTAMNGRDAVTKWRDGGFHLVLMDIQLPVMNGLEATKEIRRLERINDIGVFSSSASSTPIIGRGECGMDGMEEFKAELKEEDSLKNTELFKSPIIIVALTASSLQSDRHEALAAGCNDFLTKPVNFDWLSRKVMEWGCMQALIDFDGWRKWKDFSNQTTNTTKGKSPTAIKTQASPQSSEPKSALSPRSAAPNMTLVKGKRLPSMQRTLDGIGEDSRERGDETEKGNSNAEGTRGTQVTVGA